MLVQARPIPACKKEFAQTHLKIQRVKIYAHVNHIIYKQDLTLNNHYTQQLIFN